MRSKLIEANRISFDRIQPYNSNPSKMPMSMRRKRNDLRKRKEKDQQKRTSRIVAADMLRAGGSSIRRIASATGVSKSVVAKIKKQLDSGSESGLQAILDPENNRTGRKCVLTTEERRNDSREFDFRRSTRICCGQGRP